jgi:hypothetical protein
VIARTLPDINVTYVREQVPGWDEVRLLPIRFVRRS